MQDTEPRPVLDAGHLLAVADEHRRGLHDNDARAECSQCVTGPLLAMVPEEDPAPAE